MLPARLARKNRGREELGGREEGWSGTAGDVVAEEGEGVAGDGETEGDEEGADAAMGIGSAGVIYVMSDLMMIMWDCTYGHPNS